MRTDPLCPSHPPDAIRAAVRAGVDEAVIAAASGATLHVGAIQIATEHWAGGGLCQRGARLIAERWLTRGDAGFESSAEWKRE